MANHRYGNRGSSNRQSIEARHVSIKPKRRYRRKSNTGGTKTGRWEPWEKVMFLRGYRIHGRGKWKQIADMIPSRTTVQVKTHAQMVQKRIEKGEDVFELLDESDQNESDHTSPSLEQDESTELSDSTSVDNLTPASDRPLTRFRVRMSVPHSIIAPSPIQTSPIPPPPRRLEGPELIEIDVNAAHILVALGSAEDCSSDDRVFNNQEPKNLTAV